MYEVHCKVNFILSSKKSQLLSTKMSQKHSTQVIDLEDDNDIEMHETHRGKGKQRAVDAWTAQDVVHWLESIVFAAPSAAPSTSQQATNVQIYSTIFEQNAIDGAVLLTLSEEDLKEMGISVLGHRRKIVMEVKKLQQAYQQVEQIPSPNLKRIREVENDDEVVEEPAAKRIKLDHGKGPAKPKNTDSTSSDVSSDAVVKLLQPKTCAICMDDVDCDFIQPLSKCGHEFCRECLQGYFINAIESRKLPILCPLPDCKKDIPVDDLELCLEPKWIKLFEEYSLSKTLEGSGDYIHCFTPNCENVFFREGMHCNFN